MGRGREEVGGAEVGRGRMEEARGEAREGVLEGGEETGRGRPEGRPEGRGEEGEGRPKEGQPGRDGEVVRRLRGGLKRRREEE